MSIEVTYRCNNKQCRKVKGESNHWIAIRPEGSRQTILPTFRVLAFEDAGSDDEHYCSPVCASKRFAEIVDQIRAESIKLAESRAAEKEAARNG